MNRQPLPKTIPTTASFSAWRRAADRLLSLETELARSRRPEMAAPYLYPAELVTQAADERLIAAALFELAFAEAKSIRGKRAAHLHA